MRRQAPSNPLDVRDLLASDGDARSSLPLLPLFRTERIERDAGRPCLPSDSMRYLSTPHVPGGPLLSAEDSTRRIRPAQPPIGEEAGQVRSACGGHHGSLGLFDSREYGALQARGAGQQMEQRDASASGPAIPPNATPAGNVNVATACLNCRRAHSACEAKRPCHRCVDHGDADTCIDVQHKKRGRPRTRRGEDAGTAPAGLASGQLRKSAPSLLDQRYGVAALSSRTLLNAPAGNLAARCGFEPATVAAEAHFVLGADFGRGTSHQVPHQLRRHRDCNGPSASDGESDGSAILICSTELRSVRASDEAVALLGIHRGRLESGKVGVFDLVHPNEVASIHRLLASLIEPVLVRPMPPPPRALLVSVPPSRLLQPCAGTILLEGIHHLRLSCGHFHPCRLRMYFGGGLGADLYRPETFSRAYIIVSIAPR